MPCCKCCEECWWGCLCVSCARPKPDKEIKVYEKYKAGTSKILGALIVIIGYGLVILSAAYTDVGQRNADIMTATYIAGLLCLVTGSLGILAGAYKSKCMVVAFLVMTCISLVLSVISFALDIAAVSTMDEWWERRKDRARLNTRDGTDGSFYYYDMRYWKTMFVLIVCAVLSLVLIILLILSIVICTFGIVGGASSCKVPPDKSYKLNCKCICAIIFYIVIMLIVACSIAIWIAVVVTYEGADTETRVPISWVLWGAVIMGVFACCALASYFSSTETAMIFFLTSCTCCAITSLFMCVTAAVFVAFLGENKERYRRGYNAELSSMLLVEAIISLVATILGILLIAYALYVLLGKHHMAQNTNDAERTSAVTSPEDGKKSSTTRADQSPEEGRKSSNTRASTAQEGRKSQNAVSPSPEEAGPPTESEPPPADAEPSDDPKPE